LSFGNWTTTSVRDATPEIREAAKKVDRRLKGLRTNGDVRRGVHIEPKGDGLPNWLDLDMPDERLVASTLLQPRHPGSSVYMASDDINLQTKLAAVGLPFIEARIRERAAIASAQWIAD
jgi:predicted ribonuclease YlaK